jgi:excisionase family DNA binding protein
MADRAGRKSRGESQRDQMIPAASGTERLVYTVPEAGRLLGISRNGSYEAAKRGDIPTIRIGRRLLVPKAPFHRVIELMATGTEVRGKGGASDSERWSNEIATAGKGRAEL